MKIMILSILKNYKFCFYCTIYNPFIVFGSKRTQFQREYESVLTWTHSKGWIQSVTLIYLISSLLCHLLQKGGRDVVTNNPLLDRFFFNQLTEMMEKGLL